LKIAGKTIKNQIIMKYLLIITISILLIGPGLEIYGQVSITNDASSADESAMLDVKSTDKGVLVPRLTTTQRTAISNPADGLLVYDSTSASFWFYSAGDWIELVNSNNTIWSRSGPHAYYDKGFVGVGTNSPADLFHVEAPLGIIPFQVSIDGLPKMRIFDNGGCSFGIDAPPPPNGVLIEGLLEPNGNIITGHDLLVESTGSNSWLQMKKGPNFFQIDNNGLFGGAEEDIYFQNNYAKMGIEYRGIRAITDSNVLIATSTDNKNITIQAGSREIIITNNGDIIINSGGGDLSINTMGGNLTIDADTGNISIHGRHVNLTATDTLFATSTLDMKLGSTSGRVDLESVLPMTLTSAQNIHLNANDVLDLQSANSMTLTSGDDVNFTAGDIFDIQGALIRLNAASGGFGAARALDPVQVTLPSGLGTILTGSGTVYIGP
jgi:hypothetical protein